MKHNYLIESTDSYAIKLKIDKIIKDNGFMDANISYYDMTDEALDKALEDLDTYGFFTDKKVVVITNFSSIDNNSQKDSLERLAKYVNNDFPDNMLIITTDKLVVKDNKFLKEIKKNLEQILLETNSLDYIKAELSSYKVDNSTLKLIDEYCLKDLAKIHNECSKLKNYKITDKVITSDDVRDLVIKKMGDATDTTFSFVRALAEKNKKEALRLYQEILDYNIDPIALVGLLASQFRIMYQVKVLDKRKYSNKEIANVLNAKEYRVIKTKELLYFYSEKEILNLIIALGDIDFKIKTTNSDPNSLLQLFILNM